MVAHDIIVIGASAGGVKTLTRLVAKLPADLPAAIFINVHVPPDAPSHLPEILTRSGPLKAIHPNEGCAIEWGRIYVAPPNRHLLIEHGHIHLGAGPKENRYRPAINALFRSAAWAYGPQVIGVILTGNLDDGTVGLWEVKRRGGIAIVQDPREAPYPGMPASALNNVEVDFTVGIDDMPPLISRLTGESVAASATGAENNMVSVATRLTCPECRGSLEKLVVGPLQEFKCRVGHTYSPATLLGAHVDTVERSLWSAAVALEEAAEIVRQVRQAAPQTAAHFQKNEAANRQMAEKIGQIIREFNQANGGEPSHENLSV